jgi:molecular chaperone GrpE (heat shock protein)
MCDDGLDDTQEGIEPAASGMSDDQPFMRGWKARMEEDFRRWLAALPDEPPQPSGDDEMPDLCSFYEELAALRLHTGKTAKRTHDTLTGFGAAMERFGEVLDALRAEAKESSERSGRAEDAPMAVVLAILDVFDRIERLRERLDKRPSPGPLRAWRVWPAYVDLFAEGFGLAIERLAELLATLGVERIETEGALFDPALMSAVAVDKRSDVPDGTVVEEVTPGYRHNGSVVRYADVRVARKER